MLNDKKIVVGITGGIAAYKTLELVRLLTKSGAHVKICLTESGRKFVTPLSCQALSGHPVYDDLSGHDDPTGMPHIELARWADLLMIAPTTAHTMAKLAYGLADDMLTNLYVAYSGPTAIAPAMNQNMWRHPTTQNNKIKLQQHGVMIYGPNDGIQACGDEGWGRMLEPQQLLQSIQNILVNTQSLKGKKVVITAGPTHEPLDPVRYLGNGSSGQMGYALARAAVAMGAVVHLVSGPCHLSPPSGLDFIQVQTAEQMHSAVSSVIEHADYFIAAAAVADYRPMYCQSQKIKKSTDQLSIQLIKNPDILAHVAQRSPRPFTIGFAAETERLIEHAQQKLQHKSCDMIIANLVSDGNGINQTDNAVTVIDHAGQQTTFPRQHKACLAVALWQHILDLHDVTQCL